MWAAMGAFVGPKKPPLQDGFGRGVEGLAEFDSVREATPIHGPPACYAVGYDNCSQATFKESCLAYDQPACLARAGTVVLLHAHSQFSRLFDGGAGVGGEGVRRQTFPISPFWTPKPHVSST